jgi:hypothetical protein
VNLGNLDFDIVAGLRISDFEFMVDMLYNCRENSTNLPFLCKTNPIFPIFHLKTMISQKTKPIQSQNKPNSNPIKPISNPNKPNL